MYSYNAKQNKNASEYLQKIDVLLVVIMRILSGA